MTKALCEWCLSKIKASKDFNPLKDRVFCKPECYWAEYYFVNYMSDKEFEMRRYFDDQGKDK